MGSERRKNLQDMQRALLNGSAITPVRLNNTLEIELPYYTIGQRFKAARFLNIAGVGDRQGVEIAADLSGNSNDANFRLDQFVSVGEDFTLGMFVGAPVMYFYNNPTA